MYASIRIRIGERENDQHMPICGDFPGVILIIMHTSLLVASRVGNGGSRVIWDGIPSQAWRWNWKWK